MTPTPRTPQQRDRRFARIRRLAQALLLGSGVTSALTITFIASAAKPYVAVPVKAPHPTNPAPSTTTSPNTSRTLATTPPATPSTTTYTPPTTVPVTTTTACYTTPSGQVTCY